MDKCTNTFFFFFDILLGTLHMVSEKKSYNTGYEQGHINCLVYILIYVKLINLMVTKRKPFCFLLIIVAQEGVEIRMEGNPHQRPPRDPR
jgi:hypothetical protein